jgi:hypothetical protein
MVASDPVMTCSSIKARVEWQTVVFVKFTMPAFVPINADTRIVSVRVCTGSSIQTNVFIKRAFINILSTVSTGVVGRTIAGIRIYSVNTAPSILAKMFTIDVAIVDVYLALISSETCRAGA